MTDDRKQALGLEGADFGLGLRPKSIGARVKRVEDRRLLTGQGAFTDDRIDPGALHIAFCRSDYPHALISRISTAAAEAMPGVIGVYTARELNGLIEPVYATSRLPDYHSTALYPLARDKVRYVGEPVVAVLAESRYRAEDALDRVEIAYEPLEPVIDPERAVFKDAPLLHEEAGTNILATREFARGDLAEAMARCGSAAVSGSAVRRLSPLSLEPVSRNTIAGAVC
jgi:aerobic carbon-monoxide dehydrogenase large subunit